MKQNLNTLAWSTALGATAVILGALAAHSLKAQISSDSLAAFNTGVRYQMWHALALLALSFLNSKSIFIKWTKIFWVTGCLLFAISIYLLSTSSLTSMHLGILGPITPLGGLLMTAGWVSLFLFAITGKNRKKNY